MVVQLTLNDVIEVYEEKIHEVQLARGDAEQHAKGMVGAAELILSRYEGRPA